MKHNLQDLPENHYLQWPGPRYQPTYQQHKGPSRGAQHKWPMLKENSRGSEEDQLPQLFKQVSHPPLEDLKKGVITVSSLKKAEGWFNGNKNIESNTRQKNGFIHEREWLNQDCYEEKLNPRILRMLGTCQVLSQMISEAKANKGNLMVGCWI